MYLCEEIRGRTTTTPHSSQILVCPSFFGLSFLSVSPPILSSCSSYFSLLPGARRSVPDGNSLRLQEPPWRPHGGGTGGEQSGPVLLAIPPSRSLALPCTFFCLSLLFFSLFLPSSRFLSLPSLSVSSVSSLPGYTGPQGDLFLARVPQHRALSSPPSPTASPQLLLLVLLLSPLLSLRSPPALSRGGRR